MKQIIGKYGIMGGILLILSAVIIYVLGMGSSWVLLTIIPLVTYIVLIYLGVLSVREVRSFTNNKIEFKMAFGTALSTLFIALIFSTLFSYLLYNVIDPEYADKIKIETITKTEQRLEKAGLSDEKMEEILETIESKDFNFDFKKVVKSIGYGIIVFGIISLIIAASVKKDLYLEENQ
ncbi:MAG: DUF4199 domain-containing protein [Bacteroidota bacterium]|nr:DUF4199 domain-containing protein [Bacteroidota bacterium]